MKKKKEECTEWVLIVKKKGEVILSRIFDSKLEMMIYKEKYYMKQCIKRIDPDKYIYLVVWEKRKKPQQYREFLKRNKISLDIVKN